MAKKKKKGAARQSAAQKAADKFQQTPGTNAEELQKRSAEEAKRNLETGLQYGDELANRYIPTDLFQKIREQSSPEMLAHLQRLSQFAQTSGNMTPLEQEALDLQRSGLQGYSSPELQAQREGITQQVNQDLATQMRLQQLAAARNRVRGAAATAQGQQLQANAQMARGQIERDLFAKNADEIQRRKLAFSDLIRNTEDARFNRQNTANTLYGATLGSEESAQTGREQYNATAQQNQALARGSLAQGLAGAFVGAAGTQAGANAAIEAQNQALEQAKANMSLYAEQMKKLQQQAQNSFNSAAV